MKKHLIPFMAIIALGALSALSGCNGIPEDPIDPTASVLVVHVYGAISGDDREDIRVSLHWTQEEAEANENPIAGYGYTDEWGETVFYDLPPNEVYWVRCKALLARTVRPTDYLYVGENYIDIPIL